MTTTPITKSGSFFLKREDLNPTGSAKDRAIISQLENLKRLGFTHAVISSTGNAAISAQHYCLKYHLPLVIYLPKTVSPQKLKLISANANSDCQVNLSSTPITDAFRHAKTTHAYLLRQSTDPFALTGYQSIGREIGQQLPTATSLFAPVGSGATLLGLSAGLLPQVRLFAVQPASNPTICSYFEHNFRHESKNLCDALTVKHTPLKKPLIEAIIKSRGSGLVISNQEITSASSFLSRHQLNVSLEGALALAGYLRAAKTGLDVGNFPVILITGQKR